MAYTIAGYVHRNVGETNPVIRYGTGIPTDTPTVPTVHFSTDTLTTFTYAGAGWMSDWITKIGTIATAAVKTLHATPVSLVATPGSGYFIEVDSIHWFLDYGTATYDAAGAGDILCAHYTNGSGAAVVDGVAGDTIGAAAADYHVVVHAALEVVPVANAAVVAAVAAGEWYAAAGDSPLKYEIRYRIRTLAFA